MAATITAKEMPLPLPVLLCARPKLPYTTKIQATRFVTSNAIDCRPSDVFCVKSRAKSVRVFPF